jgi:photosystem II stability/assembly factor-like uncharacterized protein
MTKVLFTTPDDGWIFGRLGTAYRTTNAGADWHPVNTGRAEDFYGAFFLSPERGWVVGDWGLIIATTNGGATWLQQSIDSCDWLYGVCFVDSLYGWAVGDDGVVLKTTDAGAQWFVQTREITRWLADAEFVDRNHGWVAGDSASVWCTTDGGATWEAQTQGAALTAWDIEFTDSLHGWIAGGTPPGRPVPPLGLILRTNNGGQTWVTQNSGTTVCLFGLSFLDSLTGWVVGESGSILHTSTGGVTDVSPHGAVLPLRTSTLDQNYPNPFNPLTNFGFHIAKSEFVSIKVYDLLGKEVKTLVEGELAPGSYSTSWDGGDAYGARVGSGVYLYRLRTPSFASTKAMVLVK